MLGAPGTGKSATAHAIAAELSMPVATASLAALTSSFLGDTARNIESVVHFAEQTPCVLLLDEFDVLGVMSREVGQSGDGWLASEGGVGSVVIVEVQPGGECCVAVGV
ncbi:hypothetical protein B0293_25605 [Amycolatopsis azurea DSM 43854]|uniref:ATPase AAA-type core domain-containing protein n=1 Tax=Amycolatopsis azurea DSM 43854 TaxID=1238180 RepID=A0ABX3J7I8_9PSEU|nr:hypothetical protein B0293_25605 [Amycolatopsis azurea DSM 43854]